MSEYVVLLNVTFPKLCHSVYEPNFIIYGEINRCPYGDKLKSNHLSSGRCRWIQGDQEMVHEFPEACCRAHNQRTKACKQQGSIVRPSYSRRPALELEYTIVSPMYVTR